MSDQAPREDLLRSFIDVCKRVAELERALRAANEKLAAAAAALQEEETDDC